MYSVNISVSRCPPVGDYTVEFFPSCRMFLRFVKATKKEMRHKIKKQINLLIDKKKTIKNYSTPSVRTYSYLF